MVLPDETRITGELNDVHIRKTCSTGDQFLKHTRFVEIPRIRQLRCESAARTAPGFKQANQCCCELSVQPSPGIKIRVGRNSKSIAQHLNIFQISTVFRIASDQSNCPKDIHDGLVIKVARFITMSPKQVGPQGIHSPRDKLRDSEV